MGLNETPSGNRLHIAFFGRRNAGKSSVVNAVTNQEISVVSEVKGTTTDPVYKSMELLPLGPVMIIDTPGFDDEGELGELRIKRTRQVLNKTDIAVLVVDAVEGMMKCDEELLLLFQTNKIPYLVVYNKLDLLNNVNNQNICNDINKNVCNSIHKNTCNSIKNHANENNTENLEQSINHVSQNTASVKKQIFVSAITKEGIFELKEEISKMVPAEEKPSYIVKDLLRANDFVVLVVPIDSAAPKGRLILPQQQTIRDILEADATAIVVKENELEETLKQIGKKPTVVITDSQAFKMVSEITPPDIMLTSFSILMARYKGFLEEAVKGVATIADLKDGDRILISEGCTHHRQCDDIGTVKIPRWLSKHTGKKLIFETSSGTEFPENVSDYALVIHCGGCMITEREVLYRMKCACACNVPFTNYGIAIAYMQGILERSLEIMPNMKCLLTSK